MGAPKGNKNGKGAGTPRKEIAKWGEKTRFGAGNDAKAASAKGKEAIKQNATIRGHVATLMAGMAVTDKPTLEDFAHAFGIKRKDMTYGHVAAIQFFKQAMINGKVMMGLIDNVDGKLLNKTEVKDTTSWADMLAKAYGFEDQEDGAE